MDRLASIQRNFRKLQRVEVLKGAAQVRSPEGVTTADLVQVFYYTRMGNIGVCEGLLANPSPELAWLLERAKEAGKLK